MSKPSTGAQMPANPPDKLLRKWEVAERLGCSIKTVEREVRDRHLTRVKIRGIVGIPEKEVNQRINPKKP